MGIFSEMWEREDEKRLNGVVLYDPKEPEKLQPFLDALEDKRAPVVILPDNGRCISDQPLPRIQ